MMFEGLGVTISRRTLAAFLLLPVAVRAQARSKVRVGQATPAISFLPIMAARALGSFAAQGLDLEWASIPGGDPTVLAVLLRFAAEAGGDTGKGLDAATGEGRFWTDEYADAAAR